MDLVTLAMAKAYTDQKAGYAEKTSKIFFPETALEAGENPIPSAVGLTAGGNYKVMFNGTQYSYTAVAFETQLGDTVGIGNLSFVEAGEDTGESFGIFSVAYEGQYLIAFMTMEAATVAIYEETETVHTIDPKFIPGAVLPVVELTTMPTADGAQLTEAETAQLAYAVANSNYALVALSAELLFSPIICRKLVEEGAQGLIGNVIDNSGVRWSIALFVADGVGTATIIMG